MKELSFRGSEPSNVSGFFAFDNFFLWSQHLSSWVIKTIASVRFGCSASGLAGWGRDLSLSDGTYLRGSSSEGGPSLGGPSEGGLPGRSAAGASFPEG